jgi:hypothetical protein
LDLIMVFAIYLPREDGFFASCLPFYASFNRNTTEKSH